MRPAPEVEADWLSLDSELILIAQEQHQRMIGWATPPLLEKLTQRLSGVVIENRDAIQIITAHDGAHTLHFIDPPYVSSTRDAGGDYRHEMTDTQHRELADTLASLTGMVMLSGYQSSLYAEIYAGWPVLERKALADGAKERTECLWFNHAAWAARPQLMLEGAHG